MLKLAKLAYADLTFYSFACLICERWGKRFPDREMKFNK